MKPSPGNKLTSSSTTSPSIAQFTTSVAAAMENRLWAFPLAISSILLVFLLVTSFNMGLISSSTSSFTIHNSIISFLPTSITGTSPSSPPLPPPPNTTVPPDLPRLAYLVSGSKGDLDRLWRTLRALYHPRNLYVVHLDLESPVSERAELARRVRNDTMFKEVGNVKVVDKANMVTYRGPTMVANTLHACAILLKWGKKWDWFVNLSASDYPLVTQDDLIAAFDKVPRKLNFVEHSSRLGWKEGQRAKPLIVDPGLYSSKKKDIFWVSPARELPTAFKLFTGSAWTALSRDFVEYCVWGWDNLPRTLLMYYTNFVSSPEGYFQTILCNVPEYAATAVNHDLHYIAWDYPPKQHPRMLTVNDTDRMVGSNAPFARKFRRDDPVLDKIDAELLGRKKGEFTPGGWCSGTSNCSHVGDVHKLHPGKGYRRLVKLMNWIARPDVRKRLQCK